MALAMPLEPAIEAALAAAGHAFIASHLVGEDLIRVSLEESYWVVPPGLASCHLRFPALKRWAKLVRPSGAGFFLAASYILYLTA